MTDAKGNRTAFQYDNFNRQVRTSYPTASNGASTNSGDYEQIDYSGARVGSVRLRDGQVIGFHYDGLGRLSYKDNAVSETFTYNNFNQITSHTANSLTSNYSYNSLGWLKTDAQPLGTVTYDHDGFGRRTKMTYPGGFEVNYSYNDGDELTDINAGGAWLNFVYDNLGRRTQLNRSNGQTTSYGFDGSFRLNSVGFGSNTVSLGYNDADQIASRTNSNGAFNYNPGTVLITYGIDGLNRIATVNSANMSYDLRGNFTSDGASTFTYNTNNLMTSATQSGVMSHLTYDAENRLHSISKYDTTKFLYDGADIIAEYNGSNQLLRRYVHGPGMDEPLIWFEGSSTSDKRFFHADNQGSIIATTDSSGNTYATVYDEYGIRYASNETYAGRFSYTGQAYLPEIGMYYYKARMYNPIIGRFMQTDPIGYGAGLNWYNYVGSDPVNYTDPWGLQEEEKQDDCAPGETRGSDGVCATDVTVVGQRGRDLLSNDLGPLCAKIPAFCEYDVDILPIDPLVGETCEASTAGNKALGSPSYRQRVREMMKASLENWGGIVEYGFITDADTGLIGPLFTSGDRRKISNSAVRSPSGAPVAAVRSNFSNWVYTHSHPNNNPPSPLSSGDRKNAEFFGWTVIAVDKSFTVHCTRQR
ncbi:RHS repeat-associated core domain-containing protein [Asticcacaulis excentricus]|uniref:ParB-like nuclease domain-containing protein n=1 Tax=Asticcacaulis excentricus TaxID=78587 RepID=A0A3G9FZ13_9CAUL|nr:RHS repeat-associated core domain-containing protein [Asticcacaulis excentricus]BBF79586.1 ParB-like nuclease domain-containing protein [Asticcacaulis excentricus]